MQKKLISIVTPCYNEEGNILDLYHQVKEVINQFSNYDFEFIFIDNASQDNTVNILRELASKDKVVKVIVNARNFGPLRSPIHAIYQAKGDAIIIMASDLQDPPPVIEKFIKKWEEGFKIVIGVKEGSKENKLMFLVRRIYYYLLANISETKQIKNFNGFGLYDRVFIDTVRRLDDPYPYFRGLVTEFGYSKAEVSYVQGKREKGKTKNSFYILYDAAMLGIVSHSKLPLRLASFVGFGTAFISVICGMVYLIYKLLFWDTFPGGIAPLVIGLFFMGGVQLFFLGVIGEYIGSIHTKLVHMPLVVEKERINF
ncbi:MAG TPA: glycosyltransferase [Candidatus Omnitrophota bacterium]|nr:glycosyltransferase [Candidatus Omnitrophota bacterium]